MFVFVDGASLLGYSSFIHDKFEWNGESRNDFTDAYRAWL